MRFVSIELHIYTEWSSYNSLTSAETIPQYKILQHTQCWMSMEQVYRYATPLSYILYQGDSFRLSATWGSSIRLTNNIIYWHIICKRPCVVIVVLPEGQHIQVGCSFWQMISSLLSLSVSAEVVFDRIFINYSL